MASDNEDKLSKTSSSNQTDLSESHFPKTSTPAESVKGCQPSRAASEPICGQDNTQSPPTEAKPKEKITGIFTLKSLNETFPQQQSAKGKTESYSFGLEFQKFTLGLN